MFIKIISTIFFLNNFLYAEDFLDFGENQALDNEYENIYLINRDLHRFDQNLKICENFTNPCMLPCTSKIRKLNIKFLLSFFKI